MRELKLLFSPVRVGGMEVKNRLVLAPMSTNLGSEDGQVSQALIDFFAARARGGMGAEPERALEDKLRGREIPFFTIGDAKAPRKAVEAIAEGCAVGRAL